jgi:hypothetical protein
VYHIKDFEAEKPLMYGSNPSYTSNFKHDDIIPEVQFVLNGKLYIIALGKFFDYGYCDITEGKLEDNSDNVLSSFEKIKADMIDQETEDVTFAFFFTPFRLYNTKKERQDISRQTRNATFLSKKSKSLVCKAINQDP